MQHATATKACEENPRSPHVAPSWVLPGEVQPDSTELYHAGGYGYMEPSCAGSGAVG